MTAAPWMPLVSLLAVSLGLLPCRREERAEAPAREARPPPQGRDAGVVVIAPGGGPGGSQVTVDGLPSWPPQGPGCDQLVRCCQQAQAIASETGLLCQLAIATPTVDCPGALSSVVGHLTQRGLSVPPACQAGTPRAAGSAPWTDYFFPRVAGWQSDPPVDHGPAQGLIQSFRQPRTEVTADVYVYNNGQAGVRREPAQLLQQLQEVSRGLQMAVQRGIYTSFREVSPPEPWRLGTADGYRSVCAITRDGQERRSESYVTTHRAYFVKVRVTYQRRADPAATLSVAALLGAVGSATAAEP